MNKERHKIICAVYLIVIENGQIPFLLRLNTGWKDGHYGLISGHVEPNETLAEAMVREAKEEAGITIKSTDLELVYTQSRPDKQTPGGSRLDFFFVTKAYTGTITNREPEKCARIDWFSLDALPANIVENITAALKEYRVTNYGEFGWHEHEQDLSV
jgi:8-oxo-dGTP diphosphatase